MFEESIQKDETGSRETMKQAPGGKKPRPAIMVTPLDWKQRGQREKGGVSEGE